MKVFCPSRFYGLGGDLEAAAANATWLYKQGMTVPLLSRFPAVVEACALLVASKLHCHDEHHVGERVTMRTELFFCDCLGWRLCPLPPDAEDLDHPRDGGVAGGASEGSDSDRRGESRSVPYVCEQVDLAVVREQYIKAKSKRPAVHSTADLRA